MSKPILRIENLSVSYGAVSALKDISLSIEPGQIVSLIGSNGAGKSTLLVSIFGVPNITGGHIYLNGLPITNVPTHEISRLGVALVPEGRRVFSKMTVLENLQLGCTPIGPQHEAEDMQMVLKLFPILEERKHQRAGTLSGGEQQMLAIGRALMSRPKLLLLDEPSLGLAPLVIRLIFDSLQKIAAGGTTIFLVEQNANVALKISSFGHVLVNGCITMSAPASELLTDPRVRAAYLGAGL